jgi:hypothetical protein
MRKALPFGQVAARAMAGWKTPSVREAIRVATFAMSDGPPPPMIDEKTDGDWLKELEGPQRGRARELIEGQGENAFLHMRRKWAYLSTDLKAWLLKWGVRMHPVYTVELLISALMKSRCPEGGFYGGHLRHGRGKGAFQTAGLAFS